jgi:energy-coupling factor transporter transmembrane protein EcfT
MVRHRGLLALQMLILLVCRVELRAIVEPAWRLKWLFALLIVSYGLLPPESPCCDTRMIWTVPGLAWMLSINLTGLQTAGLMCLQILTVLLTSTVVRATGWGRDLVDGLKAFRLPDLFVTPSTRRSAPSWRPAAPVTGAKAAGAAADSSRWCGR